MRVRVRVRETHAHRHALKDKVCNTHLPGAQEVEEALCGLAAGEDRTARKDDNEEERHVERPVANEESVP